MSNLIRNIFVRMVVLSTLFFAYATKPIDMQIDQQSKRVAPALNKTFIIGDSTSWRLTGEYDNTFNLWNARHPNWVLDVVGGSNVTTLPDRIAFHLANVDSTPDMFVMALGTNPAAPGDTWWKWNYNTALNMLPSTTKVILVIPFRGNRVTPEGQAKSDDVARYAGYLHQLAAERDNTIVANWRQRVYSDRTIDLTTGIGEWTMDGVHQRNPFGRAEWMDILDTAVARF